MKAKTLLSTVGIGCLSLLLAACSPEKESASSTSIEPAATETTEAVTDGIQESAGAVVESVEEMAGEAKEMVEEAVSDAVDAGQAAIDDAVNQVQQEMSGSEAESEVDDMKKKLEGELKLP